MIGKSKPVINQENIDRFLHGYSPIQYVRNIHVNSYSNEALIFTRPPESSNVFIQKQEFTPFLWVKELPNEILDNFFRWKTINVPSLNIDGDHVILNREPLKIDGINIINLGPNKHEEGQTILRFKLKTDEERTEHYNQKKIEYNIDDPLEQITSYEEGPLSKRMENSFKFLFKIKKSEKPGLSSNPLFRYSTEGRERKIRGSYMNLVDFFREGGLDPLRKSGTFLNESFFMSNFKDLKKSEKILLFFDIATHLKDTDTYFFTKDSVNFPLLLTELSNSDELKNIVYNSPCFKIEAQTKLKEQLNAKTLAKFLEEKYEKIQKGTNKLKEKDIFEYIFAIKNKKQFLLNLYNKNILNKIFDIKVDEKQFKEYIDFDYEAKNKGRIFLEFAETCSLQYIFEKVPSLFYTLGPTEQFMIQTGIRFFKGFEEYSDLKSFTYDIETTALPEFKHRKDAALSPKMGFIFKIGIFLNNNKSIILEADNLDEEKVILEHFFEILGQENPDLLLTYNGENFDFRFIEGRMEYHNMTLPGNDNKPSVEEWIRDKMRSYLLQDDIYAAPSLIYNVRPITLKVGGQIEDAMQTSFAGINACDTYYAVKRAAAIDSKIENLKLKYNIKYAKVNKANRVYIPGDKIGEIGQSKDIFALNTETGDWFCVKKEFSFEDNLDKKYLKIDEDGNNFYKSLDILYLVNEKIYPNIKGTNILTFNTDYNSIKEFKQQFLSRFKGYFRIKSHKDVFLNCGGDFVDEWRTTLSNLINFVIDEQKMLSYVDTDYTITTGRDIVNRYLIDDLWETEKLDEIYSQASFLLSKWVPTTYQKVTTMGPASIWKLILTAWSYENSLAIPSFEPGRAYPGGLVGMTSSGYHGAGTKLDYSGLYPALFLAHVAPPDFDISGVMHQLVRYGVEQRLTYKDLKKTYAKSGDSVKEKFADKKQLPLKIFNNAFYGTLGGFKVSPFSNIDSAHHITALGRQHIRHLIRFADKKYGLKSIYFHTDGVNVVLPEDKLENVKYMGKGLNWTVTKGKEYVGIEAVVAEFNDLYMRDKMAVGIDEHFISCINFAKGNFIYLKEKYQKDGSKKVVLDHVGGAIIKKGQSEFIVDFIEENTMMLLYGKAEEFIQKYNEYVAKIKSGKIIAKKIASKARVTKTMEDYERTSKVKQAHMELLKKHKIIPEISDWVYYINTGTKKTDSDYTVDKEKIGTCDKEMDLHPIINKSLSLDELKIHLENIKFSFRKKKGVDSDFHFEHFFEKYPELSFNIKREGNKYALYKEEEIINCVLVDNDSLYSQIPYNVEKYLQQFNSAIDPLWVAFDPKIREKIKNGDPIISSEIKLCSGIPLADEQDDMDALMKITEEEQYIWDKLGIPPIFEGECLI